MAMVTTTRSQRGDVKGELSQLSDDGRWKILMMMMMMISDDDFEVVKVLSHQISTFTFFGRFLNVMMEGHESNGFLCVLFR